MTDYGYLFSMNLHAKLKEHIVGKVFVKVTGGDELYVKIQNMGNLQYEALMPNFSERLINGLTTDYAAYQIIDMYKSYILKKYFS